jgi:GT2 family glycosyltransferase
MELPKIGIILVNYKDYAKKFLIDCRDSLRQQNYPKDKYITYIVDNASDEESFSYLKNNFSEAIIVTREDGNYAAANNSGAQEAKKDGCEYFFICNMDTVLDENCLRELVKKERSGKNIGIIQSRIMLYDNGKTNKVNTLGNNLNFLAFGLISFFNEDYHEIKEKKRKNFVYASGCAVFMSEKIFSEMGGYDENYYMYHDDVELSLKARLLGYKIALAEDSVIYHKYEFSRSIRMLYYMERNRLATILIFYKLKTILLILPALIVTELGLIFYSILNGWFKVKMRATAYFFSFNNINKIFKQRRKAQALRIISEKEFTKDFIGSISFANKPSLITKIMSPFLWIYWKIVKIFI